LTHVDDDPGVVAWADPAGATTALDTAVRKAADADGAPLALRKSISGAPSRLQHRPRTSL
jgi:hypothetical protein